MKQWWYAYLSVISLIVFALAGKYLQEPASLNSLLETGGLIESLPCLIYIVTLVVALSLLVPFPQRSVNTTFGICTSFIALLFAGEESSWGQESILGVTLIPNLGIPDLHGLVSSALKALFQSLTYEESIFLAAIGIVLFSSIAIIFYQRKIIQNLFVKMKKSNGYWHFLFLGFALIAIGGNLDLPEEVFNAPYIPLQWTLEETSELLGSIAILFSALIALCLRFSHADEVSRQKNAC